MPGGWTTRPSPQPEGCSTSGRYTHYPHTPSAGGLSQPHHHHHHHHTLHHHHPPFSSLHQVSSSSAPTPSPSSSSSSTPSSARLASRGCSSRGLVLSRGSSSKYCREGGAAGPPWTDKESWHEEDAPVGERDCVHLSPLTEDSILHNISVRCKRDHIYTRMGTALVSINPYRRLLLYTPELMTAYRSAWSSHLPPHLYSVGEEVRRGVWERHEDHVVLCVGESGGGKTEAMRLMLEYLTAGHTRHLPAGDQNRHQPAQNNTRLQAADTLLQAFGNAKTIGNDNSSRFAKYLHLEFDHRGQVDGARTTCFMLEKGRVTDTPSDERNFHVFYQLLSGADAATLKALKLHRNADYYNILRQCRSAAQDTCDDRSQYNNTKRALEELCFTAEEQRGLLCLVGTVLKLSNLSFSPVNNIDGSEGCAIQNDYEVREMSALLQCPPDALTEALTTRTVEVGTSEEPLILDLAACEASSARDCLCQALYSRLFTWLLSRVNQATESNGSLGRRKVLGMLDTFGFEVLQQNGFSQLIINYTNERIAQTLRQMLLKQRQDEYLQEGLEWTRVDSGVDMASLQLLQQSKTGLLATLEDLSTSREGGTRCSAGGEDGVSQRNLMKALIKNCAGHPCFDTERHPASDGSLANTFRIKHYAGSVVYSVEGFLQKNTDALSRGVSQVLYGSQHPLLKTLFPEGNPRRATLKRPASVLSQTQISIASLLRGVTDKEPHVVYCLKPNEMKQARVLEPALLLHQISYHGLVGECKVQREGWVARYTHELFLRRYGLVSGHTWPRWRGSALEGSALIMADLSIAPSQYTFGRTKVYIKHYSTVEALEQYRRERLEELALHIQTEWRAFRHRRKYRKLRTAQLCIATAWRRYKAQLLVRNLQKHRRDNWAATVIQTAYVNFLRRRFLLELATHPPSESPIDQDWPMAPLCISHFSSALQQLHHIHRCLKYRRRFDQSARNRMREKVTASMIFRDRKASYNRSIAHPFVGDYVRLRHSSQWKRIAADTNDQFIVFADIVNKITRSSGKFVPILLGVSTNSLLVLDQRTLQIKYRIPATDIARISLSPFMDDIAVVHVKPSTPTTDDSPSSQALNAQGCLFTSEDSKRKGDLVLQTGHVIEVVTKLFLVVQNATGKPPEVTISTEFETNFGESTVVFLFRTTGLAEAAPGHIRIIRRQNRMEVLL